LVAARARGAVGECVVCRTGQGSEHGRRYEKSLPSQEQWSAKVAVRLS
jgi:hypothetical protein